MNRDQLHTNSANISKSTQMCVYFSELKSGYGYTCNNNVKAGAHVVRVCVGVNARMQSRRRAQTC